MGSYVIRRIIQAIPILFGISILIFAIVQLAPGSPIDRFRVPRVTPEQLDNLIRLYGLDRPVLEQYVSWITAYVQIWRPEAWGYSFIDGRPVIYNIAERLPATLLLMGTALIVTIIVSIPIGILAAVKQYSWTDKIITTFATIGYAIPSFLLGIYIWYLGGVLLADLTQTAFGTQWSFPLFGRQSLGSDGDPLDIAWHLVLPVTSLAIQSIAAFSRYLRASMLDVLRADYVRTAKAKGASGSRVIYKHALRNALIPLITLVGLSIPGLVAGAVITEFIFSYPGIGQLTITAITQNDYPTIYATAMLIGIFVILGNLVADILYGVVDPRIKY
jgi:peptide/nickel transport system permease protein